MKKIYFIKLFIPLFTTNSCSKKESNPYHTKSSIPPPIITTPKPSVTFSSLSSLAIKRSKIVLKTTLNLQNSPSIIAQGFCLGKTNNPCLLDFYKKTNSVLLNGMMLDSIAGLNYNTNYFISAYSIINNSPKDTVYSTQSIYRTDSSALIPINTFFGGGLVFYVDSTG